MNELLHAAKAVLEELDEKPTWVINPDIEDRLSAAVERAEQHDAMGFRGWWLEMMEGSPTATETEVKEAWTAAKQAERERIRARAKSAAEKVWKAGDWYVGPQHFAIEQFVEELLREDVYATTE